MHLVSMVLKFPVYVKNVISIFYLVYILFICQTICWNSSIFSKLFLHYITTDNLRHKLFLLFFYFGRLYNTHRKSVILRFGPAFWRRCATYIWCLYLSWFVCKEEAYILWDLLHVKVSGTHFLSSRGWFIIVSQKKTS